MLEEAIKNESVISLETMKSIGYFLSTDFVQGGTNTEARFLRWFPILIPKLTYRNGYHVLSPYREQHSLFKAMEQEMMHRPHLRFTISFSLLPSPMAHTWLSTTTTTTTNNKLIESWMMNSDQTVLSRYFQKYKYYQQNQQQTPTKSPRSSSSTTAAAAASSPNQILEQAPIQLTMMEYYLLHFVRFATLPSNHHNSTTTTTNGSIRRSTIHSSQSNHSSTSRNLYIALLQEYLNTSSSHSNLLLRLIIEYWMKPYYTFTDTIHSYTNTTTNTNNNNYTFVLTPLMRQGLKVAIQHVLTKEDKHFLLQEWASPFLQFIQEGFTNPNSSFSYHVQLWLLYIQPWRQSKKNKSTIPQSQYLDENGGWKQTTMNHFSPVAKELLRTVRPTASQGKYSQEWSWFVQSNSLIYTTLFQFFVKRARELENFTVVFQVWNVFVLPLPISTTTNHNHTTDHNHNHDHNWKLECLPDMKYLLEEIHHQRKQRLAQQKQHQWFITAAASQVHQNTIMNANKFKLCMNQAKQILSWNEQDFQHWYQTQLDPPTTINTNTTTDDDNGNSKEPERFANDQHLTDKGRQQLIEGTYTPLQIASMLQKQNNNNNNNNHNKSYQKTIQSFEVAPLVHFWNMISNHINSTKLFQKYIPFQINLRFMADSRNFLTISLICFYIYIRLTYW